MTGGAATDGELWAWTHTTIGCSKKSKKGMRRCGREWRGEEVKIWQRGLATFTGIDEKRR